MRRKMAAGNWKMNMTPSQTKEFITELAPLVKDAESEVVLLVPAIDIIPAMEAAAGTNIVIGGENMYFEEKGAYTGEISPLMLKDVNAQYVVIGHSERRGYFGETDELINKKVKSAIAHGIRPIMCCGESLELREQGVTMDWIRMQVRMGLNEVSAEDVKSVVIAYEPIWAIGTGKVATTEQAQEVCGGIRALLKELYGEETAEEVRILYGGSVNAANSAELFAQPDIDGGLVGGASLKLEFAEIAHA